jgi:hypothetical protein
MAGGRAEPAVASLVAGGEEHVVEARRRVRLERQQRAAPAAPERLAHAREEPEELGAGVLGAQALGEVGGAEREEVADLPAREVDDADAAPRRDAHRATLARGNLDPGCHGSHGIPVCNKTGPPGNKQRELPERRRT